MSSALEVFFNLSDAFFIEIREGRVPSKGSVESILTSLNQLVNEYGDKDSLPKDLVGVILDMSTALYSAAGSHAEPVQSELYKQFDIISDKMRELCV